MDGAVTERVKTLNQLNEELIEELGRSSDSIQSLEQELVAMKELVQLKSTEAQLQ